jgi:hypothetical protein
MNSPPMSCQARVLGQEYPMEGDTFHTTTACGKTMNKRLTLGDDVHYACNDCFHRYTSQSSWYGWMDHDYPPEAKVVGSLAFYKSHGTPVAIAKLPTQKAPLGSCATCWRSSFKRTHCQTCAIELCRACASVPPVGTPRGDFCKKCVPKPWKDALLTPAADPVAAAADPVPTPVPVPVTEAQVDPVDALTTKLSKLEIHEKPKAPKLDYPIHPEIASLSLEELMLLKEPLVVWMKQFQNKYPRLMVPYYRYRMRIEALILQKK